MLNLDYLTLRHSLDYLDRKREINHHRFILGSRAFVRRRIGMDLNLQVF